MAATSKSEKYAAAAGVALLAVTVFLIAGPFIPQVVDLLRMPYVDPPAAILIAGFASCWLLSPRLSAWAGPRTALFARHAHTVMIFGFGAVLAWVSIHKHLSINSHPDLGIFDNVLWNTIHGRVLYSSVLQRNFLGEHVAPVLLLLVPIYRIFPSPCTLLAVQAMALAIAAFPVFWIGAEKLGRRPAYVLLVAYFVNRAILGAAFFDFHEIALAVPLLSFALYYSEHRRDAAFLIALFAALLCKEEVALIVGAFGVYLWMRRGWGRLPLVLMAVGILVFLIDYQIVLPMFRGRPAPYVDRYSYLGDTIPAIVHTMLRHPVFVIQHVLEPAKLTYLLQLFGSVAFLPLLSPIYLVPVAPTLVRIVMSGLPPEYSMDFHYSAELIPFVFFSAVFGARRLSVLLGENMRRPSSAISRMLEHLAAWLPVERLRVDRSFFVNALVIAVFVASGLLGGNPLRYATRPAPMTDARAIAALAQRVPADARVAADDTLVPHFSRRSAITILPINNDADYVLMDFAGDRYEYPLGREEHRRELLRLTLEDGYRVAWSQGGLMLLAKAAGSQDPAAQKELQDVLLDFPRDALQSSHSKRGSRFGRTIFTMPHIFPPGEYRLRVVLRVPPGSRTSANIAACVFGQSEHHKPKILAQRTIALDDGANNDRSFDLSFMNPDWNLLQFRVLYPSLHSLTVESIALEPSGGADDLLAQLENY